MATIWYETIEDIPINAAQDVVEGNSPVPGIGSLMLDATTSVSDLPVVPPTTPDLVWWSTDIVFTADDYNTVSWSTWSIKLADWTSYSISSTGNTLNMTEITYVYYDWTTTLKTTTTPQTAVWANKIMVAVCKKVTNTSGKAIVQPFWTVWADIFITADNIASNTITANEIASNTITSAQIKTWELVVWTNVWQWTAVTSSGVTTIIWNTVTTGYVNALSITAGSVNADDITAGTITGSTLQTDDTWKRVVVDWTKNLITFYNKDWVSSWQIVWDNVWTTEVLALSSTGYIYTAGTLLTQKMIPLSNNSYNIGWTALWYRNIYMTWVIDFDDWDWQLSEVGWYPKWSANGWSTYFIPMLTGASTNKTTNASVIMSFWWTDYYVNVLAV